MSEDHQHETPIKTPKQLLVVIFASFAIPITLIGLLVAYVTGGHHAGSEGAVREPRLIDDVGLDRG